MSSPVFSHGHEKEDPQIPIFLLQSPTPAHTIQDDRGYLPRGVKRVFQNGMWNFLLEEDHYTSMEYCYSEVPYQEHDLFTDRGLFPDVHTTVQIVTFSRDLAGGRPEWLPPLTEPQAVREALSMPLPEEKWRWIHFENLHGPTVRIIAEAVGWPAHRFARVFKWSRPNMEWVDNSLCAQFFDQGTKVRIWFGGGNHPGRFFVTCKAINSPMSSMLMDRVFDFVDRGCARPEVVLRRDPSLMIYGFVRALVQDLRYSAHEVHRTMESAYVKVVSHPSPKNLASFHQHQDRLFGLTLNATSLLNITVNLENSAEKMRMQHIQSIGMGKFDESACLISDLTREMLRDQINLIKLLNQELPAISSRAEAFVNLAFDMLAFKNNNLLQLLTVVSLAALPLTILTGILGINYFDATKLNGKTIALILGTVGGVVIAGLIWFFAWFTRQHLDTGTEAPGQNTALRGDRYSLRLQTPAQRRAWAVMQDLDRDNAIIDPNVSMFSSTALSPVFTRRGNALDPRARLSFVGVAFPYHTSPIIPESA